MKTKLIVTLISASIIAAASFSTDAFAGKDRKDGPRKGGKQRGELHMLLKERVANKLDLTDDQQTQIKTVLENTKAARSSEFAQLKDLKEQWKALAKQDVLDETALQSVADKESSIKAKLKVERLKVRNEVMALLTEEQRGKLMAWKEKKQDKRNKKEQRMKHRKAERNS